MSEDSEDNEEEDENDEGSSVLESLTTSELSEQIDPFGPLKPRHRRLAQLLAEGKSNHQIQDELGYSSSRVSVLKSHPAIRLEVERLQDRLFEASIEQRLKDFNTPALDHIEYVLKDKTNRVKTTEKNEIAKWVIEMQKSKAPQVHDIGQNMLAALMDRLDARKTDRRLTTGPVQEVDEGKRIIDVTHSSSLTNSSSLPPAPAQEPEKDELASWIDDFCDESE